MFTQFAAVLQAISHVYPLILVLDDLQWIETASAGLLYQLSRHLSARRILIVCAGRRDELAVGRDGKRHSMERILAKMNRKQAFDAFSFRASIDATVPLYCTPQWRKT